MAIDSAGGTAIAKSELNADGFPTTAGGTIIILFIDGAYDLWLFPTEADADANDTTNALRLADNLTGGFNEGVLDLALINDLSQDYTFTTVAEYKAFTTEFPVGKRIYIEERDAYFNVIDGTGTANSYNIVASDQTNQSVSLIFSDEVINLKHWGVEEGFDAYGAAQAAIDASPDRQKNISNGNAWQVSNATQIWFPKTKTSIGYYEISQKLKVPPQKNVRFHCESPSAATLNYTGVGNVCIEFQPGGIARSIGITNLAIMNGDVAVIGGNNGMIWFDQPQFYKGKNKALWFVDAADYTDGAGGEYPTGGYTGPNESSGVNTVHVGLNRPAFHYCENGLAVEATTILLFRCEHPRFNATRKAPLILDCIDARIIQPELQGVNDWTNYGLINIPSKLNTASYIYIEHPRFGAEEFTGDTDLLVYKPPRYSIVIGELGAHVGGNNVTNLEIVDPLAFGNNTNADTESFMYSNRRLQNCIIRGGTYRNYQSDLIVENNFDNTGTPDLTCIWEDNTVESSVLGSVFSEGGRGWDNRDELLALPKGGQPTIVADVAAGTAPTISITGTDSAGTIVVTAGTGAGAGNLATINFANYFNGTPRIVLTPTTSSAAAFNVHTRAKTNNSWGLRSATALADGTQYAWDYICISA